jgi:hypothetical protein
LVQEAFVRRPRRILLPQRPTTPQDTKNVNKKLFTNRPSLGIPSGKNLVPKAEDLKPGPGIFHPIATGADKLV